MALQSARADHTQHQCQYIRTASLLQGLLRLIQVDACLGQTVCPASQWILECGLKSAQCLDLRFGGRVWQEEGAAYECLLSFGEPSGEQQLDLQHKVATTTIGLWQPLPWYHL